MRHCGQRGSGRPEEVTRCCTKEASRFLQGENPRRGRLSQPQVSGLASSAEWGKELGRPTNKIWAKRRQRILRAVGWPCVLKCECGRCRRVGGADSAGRARRSGSPREGRGRPCEQKPEWGQLCMAPTNV